MVEGVYRAKLATFKKGIFTSYKPKVFDERIRQTRKEVAAVDS